MSLVATSTRGGAILNCIIGAGSIGFIAALLVSAYWEADIRWLHFFQAWMYIAALSLSVARNRWGYFTGIFSQLLHPHLNL
jgi:hypothetical protein